MGDHQPKQPQIAGPIKSPAITMPTTCGSPSRRMTSPNIFVENSMIARSSNTLGISIAIRSSAPIRTGRFSVRLCRFARAKKTPHGYTLYNYFPSLSTVLRLPRRLAKNLIFRGLFVRLCGNILRKKQETRRTHTFCGTGDTILARRKRASTETLRSACKVYKGVRKMATTTKNCKSTSKKNSTKATKAVKNCK